MQGIIYFYKSFILGIKQATLSSYENGTVSPSNEVLYAIAKQYHVSLDWLFGISDNIFSNDIETEDNRWYANIKFYGNEKGNLYNADMCQFLASSNESRESFESCFTPKDMFDIWKKQKIADYSSLPVTKKVYEDIDIATRMKLRNEHLGWQFKKNQSDSE